MPTKKIADLPAHTRCLSPDHNPPNMMVYQPGVYEHTCSACGHVTIFTVNAVTCEVPEGSRSYISDGPMLPMTFGHDPSKDLTLDSRPKPSEVRWAPQGYGGSFRVADPRF